MRIRVEEKVTIRGTQRGNRGEGKKNKTPKFPSDGRGGDGNRVSGKRRKKARVKAGDLVIAKAQNQHNNLGRRRRKRRVQAKNAQKANSALLAL